MLMRSNWVDLLLKTVCFLPCRLPRGYFRLLPGTAHLSGGHLLPGHAAGGHPAAAPTRCVAHPSIPACWLLNPLVPSSLDLPFRPKICLISMKTFTCATGRGGPA